MQFRFLKIRLNNCWKNFWKLKKILHLHLQNFDDRLIFWKCGNSSVGRARPCQGRGRGSESRFPLKIPIRIIGSGFFLETIARVVELVDTLDLKSNEHRARAGSSPASSTFKVRNYFVNKGLRTFLVGFVQPLYNNMQIPIKFISIYE